MGESGACGMGPCLQSLPAPKVTVEKQLREQNAVYFHVANPNTLNQRQRQLFACSLDLGSLLWNMWKRAGASPFSRDKLLMSEGGEEASPRDALRLLSDSMLLAAS